MEFQVIFERLERSTPEEIEKIKERLVQKFKVPSDKAEKMIRTAPIVVKKGLNLEQANKYKSALESIGVSASIKEVDSTESSQKSPNLVDQSTTAEPATAEIDPGKTQLADTFTAKIAKTTANVEPPKGVNLEKRPLETTAVDEAFPIFYDPSLDRSATSAPKPSPQPESRLTTAENLDPLKTVVAESEKITQEVATQAGISLNKEDVTKLHPVQPSVEPAQWWEGRYILNLPFDESTSPLAPMSTGRISAQPNGIGMAHPMLDKIAYENIKLVAVFQAGINVSPKIFLDIFTSTMAKPVRFDTELINYASFGLSIADSNIDRVSDFVRFLLDKNRDLVI
ncbi:MAG: hypothetical protein JNN15_20700, partial [Blastocatellia bacterium]|nr:hypothetical protein [Blastocatellia bacterium]